MNILEYRAMVEAEKANPNEGAVPHAQVEQNAVDPTEPVVQTPEPVSQAPSNEPAETNPSVDESKNEPQIFNVDGQQVTLEELQRGYLRQSDYTRKTQEIARQQRELEEFNRLRQQFEANPELAEQVGYDPNQARVQNLEQQYYDLLLQQEVQQLSTKYADFEVNDVLQFAHDNQLQNLEHAYLLHKQYRQPVPSQVNTAYTQPADPVVDVEALKSQIRAELLAEQNTSTIITGGGSAPTPQQEVQLTSAEAKIAKAFGMTPEQFKKWS